MTTIKYTNKHIGKMPGGFALYVSESASAVDDFRREERARMHKHPDATPLTVLEVRESTEAECGLLLSGKA